METAPLLEWALLHSLGTLFTYAAVLFGTLTLWTLCRHPVKLPPRLTRAVVWLLTLTLIVMAVSDLAFTLEFIPLSLWSAGRRLIGRALLCATQALLAYAVLRRVTAY
jgi:hypothetical protein